MHQDDMKPKPSNIWRKVAKTWEVKTYGFKGSRRKLHLDCGHVLNHPASRHLPKTTRCEWCESLAAGNQRFLSSVGGHTTVEVWNEETKMPRTVAL